MDAMTMLAASMDFGQGNENLIPLVGIVCGILVAIVAIVSATVASTRKARQREETRREIAAYVAEGSMTTDDAERLLRAGTEED